MNYYQYIYLSLILVISYEIYRFTAKKLQIFDKPVKRSSHQELTITGSGIIFVFSILLWFFSKGFKPLPILISFLFLSLISFLDDLVKIDKKYRFIFHMFSSYVLVFSLSSDLALITSLFLIITIISWLNAFNFMDGINGMTCIYSILSLITFYYINVNIGFIDREILIFALLPIVILCFYNFRIRAMMFCGDAGSITIAYVLFYIMYVLILDQNEIGYILMFSVYGIETFVTIVERLIKKEKITTPHRSHLYQILSNELKYSHRKVSLIYSFTQLIINMGIVWYINKYHKFSYFGLFSILATFVLIYIIIKIKIKNKKLRLG